MSSLSVTKIRNGGEAWVDAFETFAQGGQQLILADEETIDDSKTWEIVSWDTVREDMAKRMMEGEKLIADDLVGVITQSYSELICVAGFEEEASEKWDQFYSTNKSNFFKNRNYLSKEFPLLSGMGSLTSKSNGNRIIDNIQIPPGLPMVLEIGCGVGNSILPLAEVNTDKFFIGFDCSASAIETFKAREGYNQERIHVFVLDAASDNYDTSIPDNSIDIAILIFVLSAISPTQMPNVLKKIYKTLAPGGVLMFRDYGRYDMTQLRFFAKKSPNKMGDNYYRRGDGTFAYYFELEATRQIFTEVGFLISQLSYDTRVLHNRKRKLKMYRVWIQGTFEKPSEN